jgi:hypothetical protein
MDQVHVIRHKVLVEGLSARRVAREMGVSRNTVQRYLSRAAPTRVERLPLSPPAFFRGNLTKCRHHDRSPSSAPAGALTM